MPVKSPLRWALANKCQHTTALAAIRRAVLADFKSAMATTPQAKKAAVPIFENYVPIYPDRTLQQADLPKSEFNPGLRADGAPCSIIIHGF